jgi:hypothetical protein
MSGLSAIWQYSEVACVSYVPDNQAMAILRLGNQLDRPNFSTFKQGTQVHIGGNKLFY